MKISTVLVAGAQAWTCRPNQLDQDGLPCDFNRWMRDNRWPSSVEAFNFASNNWDQFADGVKSVNRARSFCKEKVKCLDG